MRFAIALLLTAAISAAPAPAAVEDRDLKSCKSNPVLSLISVLHASAFCTTFLGLSTVTRTTTAVTVTTTATASATDTTTATTSLPGQTSTVTAVTTASTTATVPSTVTTTVSTTTTAISYIRNGRALKKRADSPKTIISELRAFASTAVSTACSCYVTTPTRSVTATATATATVTSRTTITTTTTVVGAQVTTSVTSTTTGTTTTTVTTTQTSTVTATATASAAYNLVANYDDNCIPYNYLTLDADIAVNSFNDIFNFCAAKCQADSTCVQIWVSYNTPIGGGRYWCLTGGGPDYKTWDLSEIQCQYPPIGQFANWYSRA